MKNCFNFSTLAGISFLLLTACSTFDLEEVLDNKKDKDESPEEVVIREENLFPEGIEYDRLLNRFLVSSLRFGNIGEVLENGAYSVLFDDEDLISTIGLHIDIPRQRLLVAIADLGVSVRSSPETQGQLAAVAAYSLLTGERLPQPPGRPCSGKRDREFCQ